MYLQENQHLTIKKSFWQKKTKIFSFPLWWSLFLFLWVIFTGSLVQAIFLFSSPLTAPEHPFPMLLFSLEMLTPASLTPTRRSWRPSMQHEPGKASDAADLERCSVMLSAEWSSCQCWTLSKAAFTSVSTWKVSYTTLRAEFKDKRLDKIR